MASVNLVLKNHPWFLLHSEETHVQKEYQKSLEQFILFKQLKSPEITQRDSDRFHKN